MKLSIIIPSAKDPCLQKTINDIVNNAQGEYEIITVLDGTPATVTNSKVLLNDKRIGMRGSINRGVAASNGDYLMKCDSHCKFDEGFDTKILSEIRDDWVVIPRRYTLNPDTWELTDDKPVDYERLSINDPNKIGGAVWRSRARQRRKYLLDENMVFQGSCWFMSRKHWNRLEGLQTEGYGTFTQEPIEIALKTWLGGGKVMTNKKTWYAHKHRKFGRTVGLSGNEIRCGNAYSRDFWLNNRWEQRIHDLDWLMKRFGL